MNDWFSQGLVGAGASAASLLISYGLHKGKIFDLEERIKRLERETSKQLETIHSLRDVYVTQQHFNEIMETIRETHRELKLELKEGLGKVLALLTRHSS